MLYILCCIFSFIIGWKFAKVWNLLQIAYFKKQLDSTELEDKINKKYKQEIYLYQEEIHRLRNKLDDFREYSKEDFEEVYNK